MSKEMKWTPVGDFVILKGVIREDLGGDKAILKPKYEDGDFIYRIEAMGKGVSDELKIGLEVEVNYAYFNRISSETYSEGSRNPRYFYVNKLDIRLIKA